MEEDGREVDVDEMARAFAADVATLLPNGLSLHMVVAQEIRSSTEQEPYVLYLAQYRGPDGGVNMTWRQLIKPAPILPTKEMAAKQGIVYERTPAGETALLPATSEGGSPSALAVSPSGFMVRVWLTMQTDTDSVGTVVPKVDPQALSLEVLRLAPEGKASAQGEQGG